MQFIRCSRERAEELTGRKLTDSEAKDMARVDGDTYAIRVVESKGSYSICAPWLLQEFFSIAPIRRRKK